MKKSWNFPQVDCSDGVEGNVRPDGIRGVWGVISVEISGVTQYFHPSEAKPLTILFPEQSPERFSKYFANLPPLICPVGALVGYAPEVAGVVMEITGPPYVPSDGTQIRFRFASNPLRNSFAGQDTNILVNRVEKEPFVINDEGVVVGKTITAA